MYKRLKSGKKISSEKAAEISLCAKEQLYSCVKNQFIETMKLPAEFDEVSSGINNMGYFILRTGHNVNEYYEAVSGKTVLNSRKTEITDAISDICKRAEPFIAKRGVLFIHRISGKNVFVDVDREKLTYAVSDILMNAVENTGEGGRIRVSLSLTKKFVKITIGDNGCGMEEETRAHCVEPFFTKVKTSGNSKMGLGLTLANRFACDSGGRMNIRSEEGKGTAVEILLPLMKEGEGELRVETEIPDIIGEKLSPVYIVLSNLGK